MKIVVQGSPEGFDRVVEHAGLVFHHNSTCLHNEIGADLLVDIHKISALSLEFSRSQRIFLTTESPLYTPYFMDLSQVSRLPNHYAAILTCDPFLRGFFNARHANVFKLWTTPGQEHVKKFGVSAMWSNKRGLDNYELRHKIFKEKYQLTIPHHIVNQGDFSMYPLQCQWTRKSKDEIFDWMFSFAIENCDSPGYFTEKVADCFATMTVPIFLGDPDLESRWNRDGFIRLDRDEWQCQLNHLTENDFFKRLPALRDNYERARRFWTFESSLLAALREAGILSAAYLPAETVGEEALVRG